MDINKLDIGGPEFSQCCCCLDLKLGAYIIGALSVLGAGYGVYDIIIIFSHFRVISLILLAFCLLTIPPAVMFVLMLMDNTEDSRWRYASWFLSCGIVGSICYFLFFIFEGVFVPGIITLVIQFLIYFYFYLCLRAYAKKGGEFAEALIGKPTLS